MRNQSITGIILRKRNIGENDQIVTIYSPTLGKFEASARGARKIGSHFGGHLETLNICDFSIYTNGNRHTLTECRCVNSFPIIKDNLSLAVTALTVSEIFYRTAASDEQNETLFQLLTSTLAGLQTEKSALVLESFKIKLLNAYGALPQISECGECHRKWTAADTIFMDGDGHIACRSCVKINSIREAIDFKTIKLVNYICQSSPDEISKIALSPKEFLALKKLGTRILGAYMDLELKSEKIAEKILI